MRLQFPCRMPMSMVLLRLGIYRPLSTIAVVGSGLMGSGIAQISASKNITVHMADVDQDVLKKAGQSIERSAGRIAKKIYKDDLEATKNYVINIMGNIHFHSQLKHIPKHCELVVEAIAENLPAKHELFQQLDEHLSPNCIFASNTSSLPVTQLASVTRRPDNFCGLHFFNPVPMMKLVEIIRTEHTSDHCYKNVHDFVLKLDKVPVLCKDSAGFIVNRLLIPYIAEALRLYERGDATKNDVDIGMKLGASYPMGPFELADYVGLDTVKSILDGWHANFPQDQLFQPIRCLDELVAQGLLGRKTNHGFYRYDSTGKKVD